MDYLELLKKARESLPKHTEDKERFVMPSADISPGKLTEIRNFLEIAKAFRREPKHIAKFLFKELAVPGSMTERSLVLQGKIDMHLIRKRLEEYAKMFVLCHECGKPDTLLTKKEDVFIMKCEACGARKSIKA